MLARKTRIIWIALVLISALSMLTYFSPSYAQPTTNTGLAVGARGGNSTSPLTSFVPQNIEIQAGESVTWNNPTPVAEPRSVTFMKDNNTSQHL
jgi:plastocyanin